MSYATDHRVRAKYRWYETIDEKSMTATVRYHDNDGEEIVKSVPIKFEVCPTCDGKGTHVNPSIDANGLSAEDFADDPDFAEAYHRGDYAVTCYGCNGRRVVPICMDDKVQQWIDAVIQTIALHDAEVEAERRVGA